MTEVCGDDESDEVGARLRLAAAGRLLGSRGWLPASAGNLSARLGDGRIVVTASGVHKAELDVDDFVVFAADGTRQDATDRKASDEAALHLCVYRAYSQAGAVLHTHSVAATVVSRRAGGTLAFDDFEIAKAFDGVGTHAGRVVVPVVDNDQDMRPLVGAIERRWAEAPEVGVVRAPAFLIRGHGSYVWGRDVDAARYAAEALEFLLECHLREFA